MTSATDHVCAKCGKPLDWVNWWTASVIDRYGGQSYKLCKPCAESVNFAVQAVIGGGRMTDNRTTELREKLTERGVKYQAIGKTLTYWNRDGSDNECDDADFVADERPDGTLTVEGLTSDQAIAATLGSEREKELETLVKQLWYLVNHRSGYGYAAALELIEELGIEVDE